MRENLHDEVANDVRKKTYLLIIEKFFKNVFTNPDIQVYYSVTQSKNDNMGFFKKKKTVKVEETATGNDERKVQELQDENSLNDIAPKNIGKLDMVIAFDTTGSMASYIGAVRAEVSELIPQLFKDNDDLRLGIVAFGDYCDMPNAQEFGPAYQCIQPTDNENELIRFVRESKDTNGGDGPEFYELVIKKIVEETPGAKARRVPYC